MNLEFSTPNLQELEEIVTTLIVDAKCACHIINPHKTRILMWKLKDGSYHLRIGIQKFTSQEQTDRNGETYWRYWNCEFKKEEVNQEVINQTETNPVTKFNQRQEQAKDYAQPADNTEPAVNS